ncbi:MAG: NUDIX hydrolase [Candidatus Poriferisodalaceae bacterium]
MTGISQWCSAEDSGTSADDPLATALRIVREFAPLEDIQDRARQTILRFVSEHPDALHRSCLEGHFTGSSWVVDNEATRGLILLHSKVNRWLQPGGHADGDGLLQMVALREATEETGIVGLEVWSDPIDIDVHVIEKRSAREPAHLHLDVRYLVKAPKGAVFRGNHESVALRWVEGDDLEDSTLSLDDSTKRLARYGFALAERLLN